MDRTFDQGLGSGLGLRVQDLRLRAFESGSRVSGRVCRVHRGLSGIPGFEVITLAETNMETQNGPYKDYSPSKRGLHRFPCYFGGLYFSLLTSCTRDVQDLP